MSARTQISLDRLAKFVPIPSQFKHHDRLWTNGEMGRVVGACNPSYVEHKGRRLMSYRAECRPVHRLTQTFVVELDDDLTPIPETNVHLSLDTSYGGNIAEDARLFVYRGQLHVIYTDRSGLWMAGLRDNFSTLWCYQMVAPTYVRKIEKNWAPFILSGQLFVVYQVLPLHIALVDIDHKRREVRTSLVSMDGHRRFGWEHGNPHAGSAPVQDCGGFTATFHSYDSAGTKKIYYPGLYHFVFRRSDSTFVLRSMSDKPFATAPPIPDWLAEEKRLVNGADGVVFPSGLRKVGDSWDIFCGINDWQVEVLSMGNDELKSQLVAEKPKDGHETCDRSSNVQQAALHQAAVGHADRGKV